MILADRCASVPASETLAITARVAQLRAQGKDVIGFGAGEPDFPTPKYIIEAAKRGLDEGWTRYTAAGGHPQVLKAVADHLGKQFGLAVEPSQTMVNVGGKHTLYNAMMCLINPGDEVLLPAPYWVTYPVQIHMAGGTTVPVSASPENGFRVTIAELERAITPKTRGLILNSPSNPTGAAYDEQQLLEIADFVSKHDLWVVSDEIYARLAYDGFKVRFFATLPGMAERTLTVYGLAKTYSMTGWRIGIAAGPKPLIDAMGRLQGQVTSNPTSVAQYATMAALTQPDDFIAEWLVAFDARRRFMVEALNAIPHVTCNRPEGAFYAFPDLRAYVGKSYGGKVLASDWDLINYLMDEALVALVPGSPFGAPGFARLSYATSMENIESGLDRLGRALARLD
jgi:aspartate aminotransferase